jgi:hypothetical protein
LPAAVREDARLTEILLSRGRRSNVGVKHDDQRTDRKDGTDYEN